MPITRLDPSKGIPKIRIVLGKGQDAHCRIWIRLPGGTRQVISSSFEANLAAAEDVAGVEDLDGASLGWDVDLIAPPCGTGCRYSVAAEITQDEDPVADPPGPSEGDFPEGKPVKSVGDSTRFMV